MVLYWHYISKQKLKVHNSKMKFSTFPSYDVAHFYHYFVILQVTWRNKVLIKHTVWNKLQYTTKLKKFLNNYITLNRLEVSNLLQYDIILIGKYLPTRPIGNHLLVTMVSYPRRQIVNTTVRTSHLALKNILKHHYYYEHTTNIFGIFIVSIKRNMMIWHTSTVNSC